MDIQGIIELLDRYMIEKGKRELSLRTANDVLRAHPDPEVNSVDLKELLQSKAIKHGYQTETTPRHWHIPYSNPDAYASHRKAFLAARPDAVAAVTHSAPATTTHPMAVYAVIAVVVGIIYLLVTQNDSPERETTSSSFSTPTYERASILKIIKNNDHMFGAFVRIPAKTGDQELLAIASSVKANMKARARNGTIFFLLPGMRVDEGAWAAVDFDPEATVRILGQSIADENNLREKANSITGYVGLWMSLYRGGEVLTGIRKTKGVYYLEIVNPDDPKPSWLSNRLQRRAQEGKIIYVDTESSAGEYYVVEETGDLSVYDEHGFIETYKRVK